MTHPIFVKPLISSSTVLAAAFATILLCSTASEAQPAMQSHGHASGHAHGDRMMRGNPEQMMERHVDRMAKTADATPEQKTKLTAIAKAAQADIKPLHDQLRANRERGAALYKATTIDRAAMEQHRAEQFKIMEQISRRRSQARLDSAEVLSPEQREKLATKMKRGHERHEHSRK
jgi:Spy/CpxP family protein refolding chaperone